MRYILTSIERRSDSATKLDYEQMTVEHLAPQSLIGQPGCDDATIGQIGNLLFVSEELNGKLKNKSFAEKKKILVEARYKLPKDIEASMAWGPEQIKSRTDSIAELAYKEIWKP